MRILGDTASGNCLKVKYAADHLGLPYAWTDIDILKGESRTPEFLALHPMGQVPVIVLDDGRALGQSNAILQYLAEGTALLPSDAYDRARVAEWLFWEQYSHEPYIAVCRFHMVYRGQPKETREAWRVERGEAALDAMDRALTGRDFLIGADLTIADIALLAYTRLAGEGGFDLGARPAVGNWIARCEGVLKLD
ncbi:glutathione S-transferase family protein [Thalassobaculum litoreum]|uniref:Glutathione S-transferase n=1 Tax=Thalassobaculum litoreum DSM 18839 TaxID=1123362 RepID=A0A8G2BH66_9PROT|nr:glutathione S-transferase family protein [Thalassobaculum litoreum]SDF23542.1 glutathione S-transferase [Thalassobaculum litoreum DSM 18839]